jgi:hypothetical protein
MWRRAQGPVIDAEAIGFGKATHYIIGNDGHRVAFPAFVTHRMWRDRAGSWFLNPCPLGGGWGAGILPDNHATPASP